MYYYVAYGRVLRPELRQIEPVDKNGSQLKNECRLGGTNELKIISQGND